MQQRFFLIVLLIAVTGCTSLPVETAPDCNELVMHNMKTEAESKLYSKGTAVVMLAFVPFAQPDWMSVAPYLSSIWCGYKGEMKRAEIELERADIGCIDLPHWE